VSSDPNNKLGHEPSYKQNHDRSLLDARHYAARLIVLFSGVLFALYSIATIADNSWLLEFFYNFHALVGVIAAIGCLIFYAYLVSLKSEKSDLISAEKSVYVDASNIASSVTVNAAFLDNVVNRQTYSSKPIPAIAKESKPPSSALDARPHLHTPFELYVNAIVKALDDRISLSEIKANLLLSQGKSLMGWGVLFYIVAIGAWQVVAHYWGYSYILLIGMISSSLLFVVIEFLAAWFLKQYRSYIDSSMAYLQARSVYNNYLLTYYALNQFDENADTKKVLVKMLGEKITWPSVKELSKNDFNYILESLSAFTGAVDKMKKSLDTTKEAPTEKKEETKKEPA
jgi:hypothetical protein